MFRHGLWYPVLGHRGLWRLGQGRGWHQVRLHFLILFSVEIIVSHFSHFLCLLCSRWVYLIELPGKGKGFLLPPRFEWRNCLHCFEIFKNFTYIIFVWFYLLSWCHCHFILIKWATSKSSIDMASLLRTGMFAIYLFISLVQQFIKMTWCSKVVFQIYTSCGSEQHGGS